MAALSYMAGRPHIGGLVVYGRHYYMHYDNTPFRIHPDTDKDDLE